jgi:hypothetical protein
MKAGTKKGLDFIVVYVLTAIGATFSTQVTPDGVDVKWPGAGKFISGLIIAALIINRLDVGNHEGKLQLQARVRRYISALVHGFTWLSVLEVIA